MYFEIVSSYLEDWPTLVRLSVAAALIASLLLIRYLIFAGAAYGLAMLIERFAPWRRLQRLPFTRAQVLREIGHSLISVLTFMVVIGIIVALTHAGLTQMYTDPDQYGWVWFWLQIPVVLLIQDWYFYWMHRVSHLPALYDRVHKTHHLSTNPSAFAAFAFHPLEAILEVGIFLVLVIIMPLHVTAILTAGIMSLIYNVYGHLGYEIMPRFIAKSPLGYWLNKSAYHNQHHRTYRYNYGLYTVIWDRLHGTMHPHAEKLYDQKSTRPVEGLAPQNSAGEQRVRS
ncbi:MAG: sterol desaturase family protein [Pseudomonadota bacterium]